MKLTEILTEDSALEDMEVLLERPFTVSRDDIYLVVAMGEKQRQKTGTGYDRSVEITAFFSYVANQLLAEGDDLGYMCFKKAIPYTQHMMVHVESDCAETAGVERALKRALIPLRHSAYFEETEKIFDDCFNHFLSVIPSSFDRSGETWTDFDDTSAHHMNNGLVVAKDFYESSVEYPER